MLKLCRVTKVKVLFLVLVYVFNFDVFEFSAAILEKGLFGHKLRPFRPFCGLQILTKAKLYEGTPTMISRKHS